MTLKIRMHKIQFSHIILFLIFAILFFHRYAVELNAPKFLRYILDVLNILLFISAIIKKIKWENSEKLLLLSYMVLIISGTVSTIASIGVWKISFEFYVFDCRSLLRYLIFFLSCKTILNSTEIKKIFNWILGFHMINCVLIVYQYFTYETDSYWTRGDNLNGFFGTSTGGNIYVNALMLTVAIIIIYKWTNALCSGKMLLFFMLLNIIISVLIELKAYFLEIIIIVLFYLWPYIKKPTKKTFFLSVCIIFGGFVTCYEMIQVLYKIYPWMAGSLSSINKLIEISSSNGGRTIGRISAINDIINIIYDGNIELSLLGVGLGTASVNGLMSEFAHKFYNTHYSWYSLSYIFIETGLIGLFSYLLQFIILFIYSKRRNKYSVITRCTCIFSIFLIIYNETFRTEAGYLIFFLLALAFIDRK